MNHIRVKVFNTSDNSLPKYESEFASGLDLKAYIPENPANIGANRVIIIHPGERVLIPTGLRVAIPEGYEIQIRPRSGLAIKSGISIVNTPGTIDSDYRGDIGVILINHGKNSFQVFNNDRIAQAIIKETNRIEFEEVSSFDELSKTERGTGGFGSTGK